MTSIYECPVFVSWSYELAIYYLCSDQEPRKEYRTSIESLIRVGSDDEDALDEYAEMDAGGSCSLTALLILWHSYK